MTVNDLHDQYWSKPDETEKKYRGKILQMSGKVCVASNNNSKEVPEVCLSSLATSELGLTSDIWCRFSQADADRINQLTWKQPITVRGRCDFADGNPALSNCELVEVGQNPAIGVTVAELRRGIHGGHLGRSAEVSCHARGPGRDRG